MRLYPVSSPQKSQEKLEQALMQHAFDFYIDHGFIILPSWSAHPLPLIYKQLTRASDYLDGLIQQIWKIRCAHRT